MTEISSFKLDKVVFIDGEALCELCTERSIEVEDSGCMISTFNEKENAYTFKPYRSTIRGYKCNSCNITIWVDEN